MVERAPLAALFGSLALAAAGCGGGKSQPALSPGACKETGSTTAPAAFPKDLPLPSGFRVVETRKDGDYTVADGSSAGTVEQVRDFFQRELPAAGYELGDGDAEEGEAETEFEGKGIRGKLRIRAISGCDDRVSLELAVARG